MAKVLVFGYGNTLRGDDGIGCRAAEALFAEDLPVDVEVVSLHQLAPELGEAIAASEAVLFIDATREGEPGELRCREVGHDEPTARLTHRFTPESVLDLARELYGAAPRGWEITLCGEEFDLSEELSPRVAAQLPTLVRFVADMARSLSA
jgi:hydrogenase maturation protease